LNTANLIAGRALPHDCTNSNRRPNGKSDGAHGLCGIEVLGRLYQL
jgi:hypothetical protein